LEKALRQKTPVLFPGAQPKRTFGWLNRERRLSKDYERKEESSEAFIHLGMMRLMLRRLA